MNEPASGAVLLETLREEFDRSRALPRVAPSLEQKEKFLAIRVSNVSCAIRLEEISTLVRERGILRVPSRSPDLLGVSVVHGACIPIYSLATLLAIGQDTDSRWIALCGGDDCVGLAFDQLDGLLSATRDDVFPLEQTDTEHTFVWHMLREEGNIRPVINVRLIRQAIQQQCGQLHQ